MVFYFFPRGHVEGKDDYLIYMGRDKYENEDLIKYGLPTDVWFHVDDLSSAHVYLRLPEGTTMDDIPDYTLEDCCQLVKENSIQASFPGFAILGCKLNNVPIVYTPWANLKKTADMDIGQVGFHDAKRVRKAKVERKSNDIIKRLEKTRDERNPDLRAEKETFEALVRARKRAEERQARQEAKVAKDEQRRQEDLKSYKHIMKEENMVSNAELREKYTTPQDYEEDFM
ncbi:Coiled-coil domain-containing protein 25-like protein [Monoraphidium neglectum]|uniref:Coiled-coil domain-containing protein 25-like protein n=1 Tax=Monoraphidium neglectum TaxID=145388 RepID=A0A0D2M719_9CHLO|nr:Coiled-coil domain-containing protein 25-like protein [Monoraphidium neglectum]KIY97006.1 Coiled-coil domain-containing protein 25-like protein [Monoraphidium neglectum]|eukprot:XP_013896026.1 Coiled-coil domain-containing protein 25-like protein [Monoraphidium neglectum]